MDKAELQNWVQESYRKWESFIDQVGSARMEISGVAGYWSVKDIIAHLTDWHQHVIARFKAALRGEAEPPTPWPAEYQDDDAVNQWIYERNHTRSADEIVNDTRALFQELLSILADLPADTRVETVRVPDGREFYLVWVGDKRYPVCEFFDHFRDDHEQEIREWLTQQEQH